MASQDLRHFSTIVTLSYSSSCQHVPHPDGVDDREQLEPLGIAFGLLTYAVDKQDARLVPVIDRGPLFNP